MEPGICQRSYYIYFSLYFCPESLLLFSFRCLVDIYILYGHVCNYLAPVVCFL